MQYFETKFTCPHNGSRPCHGFAGSFENWFSVASMIPIFFMSAINVWLQSKLVWERKGEGEGEREGEGEGEGSHVMRDSVDLYSSLPPPLLLCPSPPSPPLPLSPPPECITGSA